jgi:RNA polymerase sigma-70 factor (ECF subfamily)
MWTLLRQAHGDEPGAVSRAQQELMERYCGAVYRYLLVATRDPHTAEDLTQEFALRFIRGRYRRADPGRGRFRDYVKTSLFHLVDDHRHGRKREPAAADVHAHDPTDTRAPDPGDDAAFVASWRQELLARAWDALQRHEQETGQPYFTVLRYRVDHPQATSGAMAEQLGARLGKPLTPAAARQVLHRARERFAQLLREETRVSLGDTAQDRLEEELAELNLLKYCRPPRPDE